ncbi:hypothetical protein [Marinobacter sp.]|uniref:hypothetical protein n=1 Tax=Marinobacter sp. TaxID=50741 RepID=UPI0039C8E352
MVQQLINAGAIPVGKANLDQFATGLNGTRSPWGICKSASILITSAAAPVRARQWP